MLVQGTNDHGARSDVRVGINIEAASNKSEPSSDDHQTEPTCLRACGSDPWWIETFAVVHHTNADPALFAPADDPHFTCTRMFGRAHEKLAEGLVNDFIPILLFVVLGLKHNRFHSEDGIFLGFVPQANSKTPLGLVRRATRGGAPAS